MRKAIRSFVCIVLVAFACAHRIISEDAHNQTHTQQYLLFVGTYTRNEHDQPTGSKGIYAFRVDETTSPPKITALGLAAEPFNPSFLAGDSSGRHLYAVNELSKFANSTSGAVSAFTIDRETGKLRLLNEVASGGADPCYISLDRSGKFALVANYSGGSVAVFPVLKDGSLGARSAFVQHEGKGSRPDRQEGPHAHWIETTADNRFAVAADLGLDELLVYRFNATDGSLSANNPAFAKLAAGSGPRHVAFTPDNSFAYVVNELNSTVVAFSYDASRGALHELETASTLPAGFSGANDTAEVHVHPNGRFLYASNRGNDSVVAFAIDRHSGKLTLIGHFPTQGKTPRNFEIDPSGRYLFAANQDSGNIVMFAIDQNTGKLTPAGQPFPVPSPVSLRFVPAE